MSPISHGALYNNSSFLFFFFSLFCPDLDLCGLPAWLLPWQHLEPSSSCWPYVFAEAPACSSLPRGFASPSKVSLYRLTKNSSDSRDCHYGFSFTWSQLSHNGAHTPTNPCPGPHQHQQLCFLFYTYVRNVFPAACQTVQRWKQKVDITCGWVLVVPCDQVSPHTLNPTRTTDWPVFVFYVRHDDTGRKHLKFDIFTL